MLLVGLGKGIEITADKLRQAAGTAAKYAEKSFLETISFHVPTDDAGTAIYAGLVKSDENFVQNVG